MCMASIAGGQEQLCGWMGAVTRLARVGNAHACICTLACAYIKKGVRDAQLNFNKNGPVVSEFWLFEVDYDFKGCS